MKPINQIVIDRVAMDAARVLSKFGDGHPDYQEWQDLKNSLLALHPYLKGYAKEQVGSVCSSFNRHGPHGMEK
jgi:hypothetical protein